MPKLNKNKKIVVCGLVTAIFVLLCLASPAIAQAPADAVLIMHFDEGSGTIAKDASGHGNDGTIHGATWTTGISGKALSFDGVDDYVDVGTFFNLDAFTLDAWVFIDPATNTGERRIISKDNVNLPGSRELFNLKTSSPFVSGKYGHAAFGVAIAPYDAIPMGDPNIDCIESPSPLTAGWHHLAGVRETVTKRFELYVDGILVASKKPTVFGTIDSAVPTVIGQVCPSYNGEFFNGIIDELAIYSRALTAEEIKAHYLAKRAGGSTKESASDLINSVSTRIDVLKRSNVDTSLIEQALKNAQNAYDAGKYVKPTNLLKRR